MAMSIFSAFEALCAESFGQKVGFSWPSSSTTLKQNPAASAAVEIDDLKNKGKDVSSSSQSGDRRRTKGPRFAVELDGVDCFETILPF